MSDTDFDDWLWATFAETQGFTVLIVLVGIGAGRVDLLKSTHLHVIGDDIDWPQMADHLDRSGVAWDGVVMFRAGREGLVADNIARDRLDQLVRALNGDRTLIRDGEFFNRGGLRLRLDDAEPTVPILN
ncbi:hypothetical protein [Paracoccus benzoatiresistens]|uniref:Uncharacterized protein n=1 Tax=Paracoccus benzoatiresistens TaxID=2997341 RepID=A0ABT4J2Z5_9RHOB|nr:hypothetical protein [Paracoccus sp. EF6]MCZ0960791.1 hypothetical protein [Paracoccus sp. EF6]